MELLQKIVYSRTIFKIRKIYFFLLCLILLFLMIDAEKLCPQKCSCHLDQNPRIIICSGQQLLEFPKNLSDLVEDLDVSRNNISEISNDINRLKELDELNLEKNRLTSLPDNLNGLQKLQKLRLNGNNILTTNAIASLSQLNLLKVLYFSNNPISNLSGLEIPNLQVLDASHCEFKEFGNNYLNGLKNLRMLSLAENPLTNIDNPISENLAWLNLSYCDLNFLQSDTFKGLPNLVELILKDNKHLTFSTRKEALRHKNLKRLDVSNCNLDRPGIHQLPFLTQVKLSHNGIHLLPDRIFAKNRALTHLYLDYNRIVYLNKSSFIGLMNLRVLDLSGNQLEQIHWSLFRDSIVLNILNLSSNNIRDIGNLTTSALTIDFSSNLISKIVTNSLINMPKIRTLNLSDNIIETIFHLESMSLRILELKRNRLVELTAQIFKGLPDIVKIDLSGNRLTEGPNPLIFANNPELKIIQLEDNPWRCDCSQLHPIYNFLIQLPVKTEMEYLICQSPTNVSGYTWETGCYDQWFDPPYTPKNKTWGLVAISILTLIIAGGTIMSIKHAMKTKRIARNQRQQLERAEARERLRLLQRRNERLEEELRGQSSEPRIHPMELIGPPSYEEAVQMPRIAQSLDRLDVAITENTTRILGSVDNLRVKKRRTKRITRKRTVSEDNLARREERRVERIRRNASRTTITSIPSIQHQSSNNLEISLKIKTDSDQRESDSTKIQTRPPTPMSKKKKRIVLSKAGTSTDDEDSDFQNTHQRSRRSCIIKSTINLPNLSREPRSGFRPSSTTDNNNASP
ncbi:leucine-rich repeat-containing protein 15 isoform X2 [Leptopilina boulardi]|uniref:leucine-rich repeat-containing protein 15 isoform X2 n=1 Tax=Leptopilina boulardi TaxID=63433 RepID=UPI0021F67DE8|nr:leucine-rich repeat-containing protein 15 isoform X2 [Leptopilina boulardi]